MKLLANIRNILGKTVKTVGSVVSGLVGGLGVRAYVVIGLVILLIISGGLNYIQWQRAKIKAQAQELSVEKDKKETVKETVIVSDKVQADNETKKEEVKKVFLDSTKATSKVIEKIKTAPDTQKELVANKALHDLTSCFNALVSEAPLQDEQKTVCPGIGK